MQAVFVYLLPAFGGAWLVALPLWISGQGLQTPHATALIVGMMLTCVSFRYDRPRCNRTTPGSVDRPA